MNRFHNLLYPISLSILLSAVSLAEEASTTVAKDPRVSCEVIRSVDPSNGTSTNSLTVSNIEYIQLKVSIAGGALGLPFNQQVTNDTQFADCETNRACITISCEKVVDAGKTEVPIKIIHTGTDRHYNDIELLVFVEIPIGAAERQAKLKKFLDDIEQSSASQTNINPKTLSLFRERKETIRNALANAYRQNALGSFEITCKYSSRVPGFWNGEVRSQSVRVQVRNEGDFTDRLRAGKGE